jgi:5-methylcytosine-specific restriction endonuclease McrA
MPDVNITAKAVLKMIESQSYRCAISGVDLTPETATLDHRTPLSRGGQHDIGNSWIVHKNVNAAKGTMLMEEFVQMCRDVVAHVDATGYATPLCAGPSGQN